MRLKEWFSWHFPELAKIVTDNSIYAQIVNLIENKDNVTADIKEQLEEITLDEDKANQIIEAAKTSMGQDISEFDQIQLKQFA